MAGGYLDNAKKLKADEFYTQLSDIEKELKNYKNHFKGKVVFCNCDDPETSNFYYYFVSNFDELGLKKLITTHFEIDKASYMLEYEGGANVQGDKETVVKRAIKHGKKKPLKQNFEQGSQGFLFEDEPIRSYSGDFRSPECIELLKQSDIVVTNPPFSLFREYVAQLIEQNKKFIIIGPKNAITYKDIFKLVKENRLWLGCGFANGNAYFNISNPRNFASGVYDPNTGLVKFRNVGWFTNLDFKKRHEDLVLYKNYIPSDYPKYVNFDAINVDLTKEIPQDYGNAMGVPITFLDVYNPDQFEIIALGIVGSCEFSNNKKMEILDKNGKTTGRFTINAKGTLYRKYNPNKDKKPAFKDAKTGELYSSIYARILIKKKQGKHYEN
ncbi:MAG: adenine-specific methyltransferase EcoRI family protein [Treponema sp.]|jgi:hypothetical protein|nr:adenine-specific methyltransferase EcoRI family protein [Treponema sp.]